jgi:hypothetical protein
MAVENEVKYVLDDPRGDLEAHLLASPGVEAFDVFQVYLSKDARIRRFTPLDGGPSQLWFSFKRKVDGVQIEIETPMEERDFRALLPTAEVAVRKRRFKFADGDVHWDVDFLKDQSGNTYFVLAEAEMPEAMDAPGHVPGCVAAHLLRYVGRGGGFGNRRLADQGYVKRALKALRSEAKAAGLTPSCDPADYESAPLRRAVA